MKTQSTSVPLDAELKSSLMFLHKRIETGPPLQLTAETERTWIIFTDGAFDGETQKGSVGGILLDHLGTPVRYFSEHIPLLVIRKFLQLSDNPIYLIEILACYVALFLWGGLTMGRYVVMYVDNEASRLALIKAFSSTDLGNVLIKMFVTKEDQSQWKVWFGRVCSHSKLADAPSRLDLSEMEASGAQRDLCAWDWILLHLQEAEHDLGLG